MNIMAKASIEVLKFTGKVVVGVAYAVVIVKVINEVENRVNRSKMEKRTKLEKELEEKLEEKAVIEAVKEMEDTKKNVIDSIIENHKKADEVIQKSLDNIYNKGVKSEEVVVSENQAELDNMSNDLNELSGETPKKSIFIAVGVHVEDVGDNICEIRFLYEISAPSFNSPLCCGALTINNANDEKVLHIDNIHKGSISDELWADIESVILGKSVDEAVKALECVKIETMFSKYK